MPGQLQAHCSSLVNISPEQHHDFDKVIDEIGGIGSFLYLYAKVCLCFLLYFTEPELNEMLSYMESKMQHELGNCIRYYI